MYTTLFLLKFDLYVDQVYCDEVDVVVNGEGSGDMNEEREKKKIESNGEQDVMRI